MLIGKVMCVPVVVEMECSVEVMFTFEIGKGDVPFCDTLRQKSSTIS